MDPHSLSVSHWKDRYKNLWFFLCPLCKAQRRVPFRPKPGGFVQYSQIFLTAIVFALVFWPWLHWKGIVSFVPIWMVFEAVYRWRMRCALVCSQCGFDPILFKVNEHWARKEVEAHWRKKFADKGIPYPEKSTPPTKPVTPSPSKPSSKAQKSP